MFAGGEWTSSSDCSSVDVEQQELTTMMYQTGRVEVGGKDDDGEESMRMHVDFSTPFPGEPPVVFLCPEGEQGMEYNDVFGVTVIGDSVTNEGFDCNVGRMAKQETTGWGQNLQLNWLAIDSNSPLVQTCVADVGGKDDEGESVTVKVRYGQQFPRGTRPVIFATAYGEDYPDTFACCVQKNSRKNVSLNICRGIGGGWGQNLKVAVLATTMFPFCKVDCGPGDDSMCVAFPDLQFPGEFYTRPTIFAIGYHEKGSNYGDAFVCSPANVTNSSFQMNLQRGNPECNSWGQNMRCQAIFLP